MLNSCKLFSGKNKFGYFAYSPDTAAYREKYALSFAQNGYRIRKFNLTEDEMKTPVEINIEPELIFR